MNRALECLLEKDAQGSVACTMNNVATILKYDAALSGVFFNEMSGKVDAEGELPWKKEGDGWNSADVSNFEWYLEKEYGIYSPTKCRDAMMAYLATEKRKNPVKKYLDELSWDGNRRLDELIYACFKVDRNDYVSAVVRKTLVAAIARVCNPGVKFDTMLVLCGPQGIGKSTFFRRFSKGWYSDSLTISDMKDKSAAEKIQGIWITELGELAGIKKVDVETVKSFLSRADDQYRIPYGVYVDIHLRNGILVGTTNSTDGFLRDITGNRRFWPVFVSDVGEKPIWIFSEYEIDQIWAEAYRYYKEGESLFLSEELEMIARKVQDMAMETDPREGIVRDYLRDLKSDRTCMMQIWCECLHKDRCSMKRKDSYELEGIMKHIDEWEVYSGNSSGKMRLTEYGIQRAYVRKG